MQEKCLWAKKAIQTVSWASCLAQKPGFEVSHSRCLLLKRWPRWQRERMEIETNNCYLNQRFWNDKTKWKITIPRKQKQPSAPTRSITDCIQLKAVKQRPRKRPKLSTALYPKNRQISTTVWKPSRSACEATTDKRGNKMPFTETSHHTIRSGMNAS